MRATARLLIVPLGALALAACGSDDGGGSSSDTAPAQDAATASSDAPATDVPATDAPATEAPSTDAPATEAPSTEAPVTASPATDPAPTDPATTDPASGVAVSLVEWAVEAPTEIDAGTVTFDVTNDGRFSHEFVVIAGDGYDSLPQAANGAVLEDELEPGAVIGRIDRFDGGVTESLTVDLAPGNYVLLCNIAAGPSSHAGQGQTLDVTVG